jgi:nucleoside-diphosphate-sugar epimerase
MFGPGDERMLKLFSMIKKRIFVIVGDGNVYFQPAYIDDVVRGFLLAMTRDEAIGEAFIIGSPEYVTLNELVVMIANELHVPPPRWRLPMRPVVWLAKATERVFVPLGLEPPLHERRVSFYQNNRAFSIEKARQLLGFEPQSSLREGIQKTILWYEEKGWL